MTNKNGFEMENKVRLEKTLLKSFFNNNVYTL